ncbi:unnamed protein product [Brassicogethes aeneus]|uniref:Uncharacterized protein n=1 Tax=Brassicogethes aeneus TaxID=1431903 RepID=A0A9P0BDN2_BRAAE|nr:unnamed protein product [Brassicogethes aeneus]
MCIVLVSKPSRMRLLVVISFAVCLVTADVSKVQDVKTKQETSSNAISSLPKQEPQEYYQQQVRQYRPVHVQARLQSLGQTGQYVKIVPKSVYVNQQPAMIIIAHPALVPANLLYNAQAHQLLNYFHSHPQAKYQFLHGNNKPQYSQQKYTLQQVVATQPNYQVVASNQYHQSAPYYHQTSTGSQTYYQSQPQYQSQQIVPTYHQQSQSPPTAEGLKYSDLLGYSVPSKYYSTQVRTDSVPIKYYSTQVGTDSDSSKYYSSQREATTDSLKHSQPGSQSETPKQYPTQLSQIAQYAAQQYLSYPSKSTPAIITGFENFSPEQQTQIRSQLTAHFGQINDISPGQSAQVQVPTKSQYSSKYQQQTLTDFEPSPEIKEEPSAPGLGSIKYEKN